MPPFRPEPFKGRKDPKADGVVLMELFTGAQCMPCVSTDVAFDVALEDVQAHRVHRPPVSPARPRLRRPDQQGYRGARRVLR